MGVQIRQKQKGKGAAWWVFVAHNGKRTSKLVGDKDAAKELAKKLRVALAAGDFKIEPEAPVEPLPPALTFGAYADTYLVEAEHSLKRSTWQDYTSCIKCHLKPALGERALAEITRRDVKDFVVSLRQAKKSAPVVRKALRVLSSIMSEAMEDEKIASNPVIQIRTRRKQKLLRSVDVDTKPQRRMDPLTQKELTHLLVTARTHSRPERRGLRKGHVQRKERKIVWPFRDHFPFLLLLARTGCRLGEGAALRWGDVDWHGQFITIEREYVRGRITTTKTDQVRQVQMSPQLRETLRELYRARFGKVIPIDAEQQAGAWIFPDGGKDGPLDPDNFRSRIFGPLLTAAGLRKIRIHDLRHTYASQMMAAGKELHFTQQQLGHHDPGFTLRVYGHLLPRDRRSEVDCLDDPKLLPRSNGEDTLVRREQERVSRVEIEGSASA